MLFEQRSTKIRPSKATSIVLVEIETGQCSPNSVEEGMEGGGLEPMKGEYPGVSVTGRSESRKFRG